MSLVKTSYGMRHIEGGSRVQLPDDEREWVHLHFDGNTSLPGATNTLRIRGWIRPGDIVTAIRSCNLDTQEKPPGHLVIVRSGNDELKQHQEEFQTRMPRARSTHRESIFDTMSSWDELISKIRRVW